MGAGKCRRALLSAYVGSLTAASHTVRWRPEPEAATLVVAMLLGFAVAYPEAPETQRRGWC
jgi:hypothetical protein